MESKRTDTSTASDVPCKSSTQLLEYDTSHKKRGLAIIFNQEQFECKDKNLKCRTGSTIDKENLTERFQELGFKVEAYDNLSLKEMRKIIKQAAAHNHKDADCFVCVFLTYGEDGHIYAYDDKVNINEVIDHFKGKRCKSLVGKPKIFIFEACRCDMCEDGATAMIGEDQVVEDAADIYTLPTGADFLMCYSVSEGYQAFRDVNCGSFYIQDLSETLTEQGSTLEFTELLTLVNMKVSRREFSDDFENKKQMPCFTSLLTKKLYFRPKKEKNKCRFICIKP